MGGHRGACGGRTAGISQRILRSWSVLLLWTSGANRPPSMWAGNRSASARRSGSGQGSRLTLAAGRAPRRPHGLLSVVRPPAAPLIVRSLSKPPVSAPNSWNASGRSRRPETLICRRFCILGAADLLLAMQKVEGSNPFSRSRKGQRLQSTSRHYRPGRRTAAGPSPAFTTSRPGPVSGAAAHPRA